MRTLFIIFAILFVGALFFLKSNPPTSSTPVTSSTPSTSAFPSGILVTHSGQSYQVFLQEIKPSGRVQLIPNFTNRLDSNEIAQKNDCKGGINGGFYDTSHKPLGLFWADSTYINKNVHETSFFNGFVFKMPYANVTFSTEQPPVETTDFVFQTGPIFTPQSNLKIIDDSQNRRMLLGETTEGELFAMAIVEDGNINNGPLLSDTPAIVAQLPQHFSQLINLDGGSASAFKNRAGVSLGEITPIGSFLCLQ